MLQNLWGRQSCLQPAFSRLSRADVVRPTSAQMFGHGNAKWDRPPGLSLEFLHFSGSGSAYELLFCCLELEFLQKLGVFGHFLA